MLRRQQLVICGVLFLLMTSVLVGCQQAKDPVPQSIIIVDQKDREITFETTPQKMVSLAPSITEIIYELNLGDKLIGVTEFCNYPEEALEKEKMGSFQGPNVEKIVAAEAQVVFASDINREAVEQIESVGIKVVVLCPETIDEVFEAIELVGKVMGIEQEASTVVEELRNELELITGKTASLTGEQRPMVYYEVWHDPLMTAGPGTFIDSMISLAGGINIGSDADTAWPSYSEEQILMKNPDCIVLGHSGQTEQQVLGRTGWKNTNAVKNANIKAVNADIFNRPGPRVVQAITELAELIHPEIFGK